MLKKHFKMSVILLLVITLISAFCVTVKATDDNIDATSVDNTTDEISEEANTNDGESEENEDEEDNFVYEDLYIFDDSVTMDKIVDGNVYIFGDNVKITGKVNGNVFVFGNDVTFTSPYDEDDTEHGDENYCYIAGSIYAFASKITFNAIANDIYVACVDFDMSYDSYIMRDVRIYASDIVLKGYVTRDAYLYAENNIDFGTPSSDETENDAAFIAGDLKYFSKSEMSIPEEIVAGEVSYNSNVDLDEDSDGKTVGDYLMNLLDVIIYTFVIYLILVWLMPKLFERTSNELKTSSLLTAGIGIIALIIVPIAGIILLCLTLASLSITLFVVYGILIAIAFTVTAASLTYLLKDKLGFDSKNKKLLLLLIITIVLWALKQIPYVGTIITIIITIFGLGLIVKSIIDRNKAIEVKE